METDLNRRLARELHAQAADCLVGILATVEPRLGMLAVSEIIQTIPVETREILLSHITGRDDDD